MDRSGQKRVMYTILALAVGIPIAISFWSLEIGIPLLLLGLLIAARAVRFGGTPDFDPNEAIASRRRAETGRTVLVQVVDDYGRELPPAEVERRLAEARARAEPRDNIVPARFVVDAPARPAAE